MAIKLNNSALSHARALIRSGAVDRSSPWDFTAGDGDALLGSSADWPAYGNAHLGVDPTAPEKTKGRYHYPFAKRAGGQVKLYLSALRAIRSRAAQQGQRDIFDAAGQLYTEATKTPQVSARAGIAACVFELGQVDGNAVQLFPAGTFRAWDGRPKDAPHWKLDAATAQRLAQAMSARANPIVIDYEHQTQLAELNGQPAPAAGWFSGVEYREGSGLWATGVEWTERARAHIDANEYRYISPVFGYNRATGEVLFIQSAALTNNPGLDGMAAVRAAARAHFSTTEETPEMNLSDLIALLQLADTATEDDVKAALTALQADREQLVALRAELQVADGGDAVAALRAKVQVGEPDPAKYVPVEAMKELRTEVERLKARDLEREIDGLVQPALQDGRLAKSEEEWARRLGRQDMALLKESLEGRQPLAALKRTQTGGKAPASEGKPGELTESQLAICRATGIDPAEYKKQLDQEETA